MEKPIVVWQLEWRNQPVYILMELIPLNLEHPVRRRHQRPLLHFGGDDAVVAFSNTSQFYSKPSSLPNTASYAYRVR